MSPDDFDDDALAREQIEGLTAQVREMSLRIAVLRADMDGQQLVVARMRRDIADMNTAIDVTRDKFDRIELGAKAATVVALVTTVVNVGSLLWNFL